MKDKLYTYEELLSIIALLRSDRGCAWDRKQTHESLKANLIEESYELVEAINKADIENMKEELGDVLLQVLMHAQIAAESDLFTMTDVVDGIAKKMVYRHPHVFKKDVVAITTEQVLINWEKLKKKEKKQVTQTEIIEAIPKALPALIRAHKIQRKVAQVGFNPKEYKPILDKVKEEIREVEEEIQKGDSEGLEAEIGDLLFSIVNLSSFFEINPEFALTKAMEKFINRFRYIENATFAKEKQLSQMTLEELDELWNNSKKVEANF